MLVMLRGDYPYSAKDAQAANAIGAAHARNETLGNLMVEETNTLAAAGAISDACHRVMTSCFSLVPGLRPTAAALLADPWFTAGAPYPQLVRPTAAPVCRKPTHTTRCRRADAPWHAPLRIIQACAPPPVQTAEDLARLVAKLYED
jgi:hypothetical protein